MTPLVGKYLNASLPALGDRNTDFRKYFASAIRHLIGIAKEQTVSNLFKKLNSYYFDEQSGKSKSIVLTLSAINKKHADIIKDYSAVIMPFTFFAKHEEVNEDNKSTVEMWQELWNDVSFGDSMLQLYLNDFIMMLETSLNSQSWLLEAQSGSSISTVAKRLEEENRFEDVYNMVWVLLDKQWKSSNSQRREES